MIRLFASSAAKLSCRQVQAAITEIIAHTACQVSIWTMSPETVRQTAEVLWRQSVYGSGKTANGRSFIGYRICGALSSNRIAADDNPMKLMSIAMKPLAIPPFPLEKIEEMTSAMGGDGELKW